MSNREDGLESFPLEPGNSAPPDGDWMKAFPDERLTDCVVIHHKTVSAPPAPLIHRAKPMTPVERVLEPLRRHAMATSLVALTVMVAPVAILLGARAREGRDARPVVASRPLQANADTVEASADRHSLGVGGPPADTLNLTGSPAREREAPAPSPTPALRAVAPNVASRVATLKSPTAVSATPAATGAATESSTSLPTPLPAPTPTAVATPTPTPTPTPSPIPIAAPISPTLGAVPASGLSVAPPPPNGREVETAAIKLVLDRYRQAFDTLTVAPVEAYWPSINAKGLTRAFGQLDSQTVTFDSCDFDINRDQAAATCLGRARFTTKVGSRTPHVESRRWAFRLARMSDRWVILSVESR